MRRSRLTRGCTVQKINGNLPILVFLIHSLPNSHFFSFFLFFPTTFAPYSQTMVYITLRRMRQWVLFLATFNFFFTIGWYSYCAYANANNRASINSYGAIKFLDGLYILIAIILFFTYIYSLMSHQPRRGNTYKFTRAILLLLVAGTLFCLRLFWAVMGGYFYSCELLTKGKSDCYMEMVVIVFSMILAFFVFFWKLG